MLGLGLAALGRPAYINLGHAEDMGAERSVEAMRARAHEVLDLAYARGVRWFDCARSYGRAEEFLASWLELRAAPDVTVSSKWGYTYTADWRVDADEHEVKDLSAATFDRQLAETRAILGERLALYQIHSATLSSGVLHDREVRARLGALRESGVRVGLSVTGAEQAVTLERALELGGFDAVQATWNLHERSAESALAEAHDGGLTVLVKEAVANGRLTPRGANAELERAAQRAGVSSDALALAAALARPWADVVLSGAATPEMLESNLRAPEVRWSDELEAELARLREEPERYWQRRSELAWD